MWRVQKTDRNANLGHDSARFMGLESKNRKGGKQDRERIVLECKSGCEGPGPNLSCLQPP